MIMTLAYFVKTSICIPGWLFFLCLSFFFGLASTQNSVSLNSSLNELSVLRPGENITIQCTTWGSSILAWTGNHYVDSRIEFVVFDQRGTKYTPNGYTTAELVNAYTDGNGLSVIESKLDITVQSSITSSTITCHNVGTGETRVTSFQTSNTPLLTCNNENVCPGQFRNFSCEIRDSVVLAWESDKYIGPQGSRLEFLSTEPVGTAKVSEINQGVIANLTENYIKNGVRVLKCVLNISEISNRFDIINVMCLNVGLGTESSCEVQVDDSCGTTAVNDEPSTSTMITEHTKTSGGDNIRTNSSAGEEEMGPNMMIIIVMVVTTCFLVAALCTACTIMVTCYMYMCKRRRARVYASNFVTCSTI